MRSTTALTAALVATALTSSSCLGAHRVASAPPAPPACRSAVTATGSPAIIDWILAEPGRDRAILDEWCRTVGRAVVAIELPFEHQRRVAVAASVPIIDAAGRLLQLHLVCAHLDTRTSWRRGGFLWFGRARQARALVRAIEPIDAPTILGGDFNSSLGAVEPDVRRTRERFPQTPPSRTHVTFPLAGRIGLHLDHLFFSLPGSWHAEVSTLHEPWGSDHYPIVAVLQSRHGM